MSWAAVAVGGATVASGYMSYKASQDAAEAQSDAADQQVYEQRRQFDLIRKDQKPYRQAGDFALGEMQNMLSGDYNLKETPGYEFRFQEGMDAMTNNLAATGNRISGRAMKEAQRFGQGMASQEFGNRYNRLAGLAGTGQTSVQATGQAGMQAAGNISNALGQAGAAEAQGIRGAYGGMNQAIQGGIGNYLSYRQNQQLLNRLNSGGGQ